MEFGLSGAVQLASRSATATSSRAGRRPGFRPAADRFAAGVRPARELVRELDSIIEFGL